MSALALDANRFTALYAVVTRRFWRTACGVAERFAGKSARIGASDGGNRGGHHGGVLDFVVVTNRWAIAESRPAKFGVGVDESVVPVRALSVMMKLPGG